MSKDKKFFGNKTFWTITIIIGLLTLFAIFSRILLDRDMLYFFIFLWILEILLIRSKLKRDKK